MRKVAAEVNKVEAAPTRTHRDDAERTIATVIDGDKGQRYEGQRRGNRAS
jgi:hypothetical protein